MHGRGGTARGMVDLGLPQFLAAGVAAGVRPFALVAVDCGDAYFTSHPADDAMRMLVDEVPRWVGTPVAALGISMGAFGALRLARKRRDLRACAAVSPALFPSWGDAQVRHAFSDEAEWAADEPLRHLPDLAGRRLGVWCGTEDPFIGAARQLIDGAHPEHAATAAGAHNDDYWRRVLPDVLHWIGQASR